jgi:antitoxin ParD1/3/4
VTRNDGALVDNRCQVGTIVFVSNTITMNVALPEPMRAYVAERVAAGHYGNTSEYVRELIRRDQRDQERLRLRALVEEGLAGGPATPMSESDWSELSAIVDGKAT